MTTKIPAIHYDTRQFRDIVITGPVVNKYWITTDKGALPLAEVFPTAQREFIVAHFNRITDARALVAEIEGDVYSMLNDSASWRHSL